MDLGERTPCCSITWALLIIIVCQMSKCEMRFIAGSVASSSSLSSGQNFILYMPTLDAVYCSHRILFLTILATISLTLLGCLGCICCCCCRFSQRRTESLDAYAPRTQSIVWPPVPEETAHVLEVTFLHTPGAADCLCRRCCQAMNTQCPEDCLNSTDC